MEGIKERQDGEGDGEWGRGGGLLLNFEGGDYFKYFRLRGAYLVNNVLLV